MTKRSVTLVLLFMLAVSPAVLAAVNVTTLPPPAPTTKIRLFVHLFTLVSSDIRLGVRWPTSHEDYLANAIGNMERTGIYEIVSASDVKAAIGDQDISYAQMERNDWGLAREIGKGLHADYVMVITRKKQKGMQGIELAFEAVMVNTGTGKNYRAGYTADSVISADVKELAGRNRQAYRTVFSLAKEDLLAVAVKKSRAFVPTSSAPPMRPEPAAAAPGQGPGEAPKKVLVCDLDSNEQYRTVGMVLAEALREELRAMKKCATADPADLQKVRASAASRGTGPIDDAQAAAMGREAAADQVVTGRIGLDGEAFFMQAKRMGVEAGSVRGRASMTFKAGQEAEALKRLPELARELMAF